MPSLWLPTDNPWQWCSYPVERKDDSVDVANWGMREFIDHMQYWPQVCLEVIPTNAGEKKLTDIYHHFYIGLAKWLKFYELGRAELMQELFFTSLINLKPRADLSIATLRFTQQFYPKLERAQIADSPEQLWFLCEISDCRLKLKTTGLAGRPNTDSNDGVKGKTANHQSNSSTIALHKTALWEGESPEATLTPGKDFEPSEHLIDLLMHDAVRFVNNNNDYDLGSDFKQYLKAQSDYNRLTGSSGTYQTPYLDINGNLHFTGKSKKLKTQGFKPKRSRGRPPKGNNVKNY